MSDTIECGVHGAQDRAYVCSHLAGPSVALGFHVGEEDGSDLPDAWCDDCELIRTAHNGWNEESEKLLSISLICAACYRLTRIRNTRPTVTLESLSDLRWKCGSCDEWHFGPCLDFGFDKPYFWKTEYEETESHLDEDYCSIEDRHFFVRGVIELPIVGSDQVFRWGVWGSLSKANFDRVLALDKSGNADEAKPMFSWLSSQISDYSDTLNLKMYARLQKGNERPRFELEPSDHPLAQEQRNGILPERIRQITLRTSTGQLERDQI